MKDQICRGIIITVTSAVLVGVFGYATTSYVDAGNIQLTIEVSKMKEQVNQNTRESLRQYQTIEKMRDMLYDLHKAQFPTKYEGSK